MQGLPFSPTTAATAGKTIKVTGNNNPTSVAGTLTTTAAVIRVFNSGAATVFVRISAEATPTAAATDVPVGPGRSITMQNPAIAGAAGLAVLSSTATTNDVFFTPGEGGMVEG